MVPPKGKYLKNIKTPKKNDNKSQQVTGESFTILGELQVLPPRSGAAERRGPGKPILPFEHYVPPGR